MQEKVVFCRLITLWAVIVNSYKFNRKNYGIPPIIGSTREICLCLHHIYAMHLQNQTSQHHERKQHIGGDSLIIPYPHDIYGYFVQVHSTNF